MWHLTDLNEDLLQWANSVGLPQLSFFSLLFLPGDDICINADFENTCSRIVMPKAAIVAKHTYLANGQTKVFSQKLSCVRGNHIVSGMSESWRGKTLRVKKIKPSILGCNILRVEYFLQVRGLERQPSPTPTPNLPCSWLLLRA